MPRPRPVLAALAAAALLAGAAAAPAQAGCGGPQRRAAAKRLGDFRAPLILGDSVLLGAMGQVARQGFEVDARGCRGWAEGTSIVYRRKRAGTLPHLVAMFLGADWNVSVADIRKVMAIAGPSRVLALVTPREVGGSGGADAQHMRQVARSFPERVLLLDWVRHTRGRDRWFAPDGLHLGYGGAAGLARFLRRALPYAAPGRFPGSRPKPGSGTPPAGSPPPA